VPAVCGSPLDRITSRASLLRKPTAGVANAALRQGVSVAPGPKCSTTRSISPHRLPATACSGAPCRGRRSAACSPPRCRFLECNPASPRIPEGLGDIYDLAGSRDHSSKTEPGSGGALGHVNAVFWVLIGVIHHSYMLSGLRLGFGLWAAFSIWHHFAAMNVDQAPHRCTQSGRRIAHHRASDNTRNFRRDLVLLLVRKVTPTK